MSFILENKTVKLVPLKESHAQHLWPVAATVDVFTYGSSDISSPEKLQAYLKKALNDQLAKKTIAFAIYDKLNAEYVGSTRYGNIDANNKVLHIGWTWISKKVRGTGFNHQMKYLMLKHAFDEMGFEKVEFRIDERNIASRKAVEKLGAILEGILKKNVITKNNIRRNSCCYGILKEDWKTIKASRFSGINSTN